MNTRPALPQVADGQPEPIRGAEAQKGVVLHDDVGRAAEAEGYARKIPGEPSILSLFEQGRDTLEIAEYLSLPEHVVAKALHIERSAALGRDARFDPPPSWQRNKRPLRYLPNFIIGAAALRNMGVVA